MIKLRFYIPYRIPLESGVIGKNIREAKVQVFVCPTDGMLQVAWHAFECLWCDVSVAAAHGTWEGVLHLGALLKSRGKQERKFLPFLSSVPLIYTTRHALPYLNHLAPEF